MKISTIIKKKTNSIIRIRDSKIRNKKVIK